MKCCFVEDFFSQEMRLWGVKCRESGKGHCISLTIVEIMKGSEVGWMGQCNVDVQNQQPKMIMMFIITYNATFI